MPSLRSLSLNRRCLARIRPSTTGLTASRWLGLGVSDRWTVCLSLVTWSAEKPEVVLHVAVAGDGLGQVLLELAEDHPVRLVEDVGQDVSRPRCGMPRTISRDAEVGRPLDDRVEQRDQHLAPFEREPLLAHVMRVRGNVSNSSAALSLRMIRRFCRRSKSGWLRTGSIRSWSQWRTCGLRMCMYSTPIVRQ